MNDSNQEKLVRAYNALLEHVEQHLSPKKPLRDLIEEANPTVSGEALSNEEWSTVKQYLLRDAEHAGRFLADKKTDDDLNTWLSFDIKYVEQWLWEQFSKVADQSKLEFLALSEDLESAIQYKTGEVAAPGTLQCLACNKLMTKHKSGRIPPCSHCSGTVFERYVFGEEDSEVAEQ